MAQDARKAAVELLMGVTDAGRPLSDQIESGILAGLDPAGRARAQRLALSALRLLGQADEVLTPLLKKAPPPYVRAVLLLAVTELLADRQEAYGVVNAAVSLTRQGGRRTEGFAGLVNAVLRRISAIDPAEWSAMSPQTLPVWLRSRLIPAYGKGAVQAMERAHRAGAAIDLTPRDGNAGEIAASVGGVTLPGGSVRLPDRAHVSELPGFDAGDWWVQDAAAATAAKVLAARPGEAVLDLCAAPGGKSLQLAAAGASVTALDVSGKRMERVVRNLERCRLTARLIVADLLQWQPAERFDAILLDAPCSATGTIRRHPDLPLVKDAKGLRDLTALQAAMIDRAIGLLRPGGRLVFATCSLLPEEGERQAAAALSRHPGLRVDGEAPLIPGIDPAWIEQGGGLRLRPDYWPGTGGMDGFYIAMFRLPP